MEVRAVSNEELAAVMTELDSGNEVAAKPGGIVHAAVRELHTDRTNGFSLLQTAIETLNDLVPLLDAMHKHEDVLKTTPGYNSASVGKALLVIGLCIKLLHDGKAGCISGELRV